MIRSAIIDRCLDLAVELVARRKNPIAMARLFGIGLFLKYLLRRLSIPMIEQRFYQMTGLRGGH
jgi:hypothetical protein